MIDQTQLTEEAATFGVLLNAEQTALLNVYAQTLVEWNEKMNLTAIVQPREIVTRHFADSLALLAVLTPPQGARIADVGTGAGFPSVPVKVARPDVRLTLIDSLNKRIVFLKELSAKLGQQDNECVHLRAEDAGKQEIYREQFDLVTARAVAHLRELTEYCLPLVKQGGVFAALKSGEITQELHEAEPAIRLLGGQVKEVKRFSLADASARSIIIIEKISRTSTKYPRTHGKIIKEPLI